MKLTPLQTFSPWWPLPLLPTFLPIPVPNLPCLNILGRLHLFLHIRVHRVLLRPVPVPSLLPILMFRNNPSFPIFATTLPSGHLSTNLQVVRSTVSLPNHVLTTPRIPLHSTTSSNRWFSCVSLLSHMFTLLSLSLLQDVHLATQFSYAPSPSPR